MTHPAPPRWNPKFLVPWHTISLCICTSSHLNSRNVKGYQPSWYYHSSFNRISSWTWMVLSLKRRKIWWAEKSPGIPVTDFHWERWRHRSGILANRNFQNFDVFFPKNESVSFKRIARRGVRAWFWFDCHTVLHPWPVTHPSIFWSLTQALFSPGYPTGDPLFPERVSLQTSAYEFRFSITLHRAR